MAAHGTPNYVYFTDQQLGLGASGSVYLGRHKVTHRYIFLARPACLPGGLYILPMFFFIVYNKGRPRSHEILGSTGRIFIFTKLSGFIELCTGLINPGIIWRYLKGRCHGMMATH